MIILFLLTLLISILFCIKVFFPIFISKKEQESIIEKLNTITKPDNTSPYDALTTYLIHMDILFSHTLKALRIKGNTTGERLQYAQHLFDKKQYQAIWDAHKARNTLVHEHTHTLSPKDILKHASTLRKATLHLLS